MKALVLKDYHRLIHEEAADPEPGFGEVLLRVRACGICGSDVHGLDGSTGRRIPPLIMGHEAAGEIAGLGPGVADWEVGQRVTFDSTIYCGSCWHCRRGEINLCDNRRVLGVSCQEYRRDGAFAQYVVLPQHILYRLPEGFAYRQAALVEALSIAVHAVRRLAPQLGDCVAVVGAGIIGLLVVQVLKSSGCSPIAAVDPAPGRRELARRLGAELALDPEREDVPARLRELTGGRGADGAVALQPAVALLRKGGALALIGNLQPQVELPLQAVVTREISVHGSCASRGEYPTAIQLIAGGKVDVDCLISAEAPLAEGAEWFRRLYAREAGLLKVVLVP
jgi:L-iditol 2-dehydrogenase